MRDGCINLGKSIIEPTRIYVPLIKKIKDSVNVKGIAQDVYKRQELVTAKIPKKDIFWLSELKSWEISNKWILSLIHI